MRINTNLSALNAYRNLSLTDNRLSKSLERLSSGLRINRAADDAAGLAISEKMRGQIRGLNQAMRNAMDGISLMQTAEGALNETHAILQRMRELSVQASSDTLTSSDRIEIQREIGQLISEINRISSSTEFNTKKLLDGSSAALTSTSDLNTKIFMRDGLRTIDQFGQKAVGGGNYKLDISAIAGKGEVQKTDIMKVKHGVMNEAVEEHLGHATFIGAVNSASAGNTLTVTFNVDGTNYTIDELSTDSANTTADAIAAEINAKSGLNDVISASSTGGVLTIRRFDAPGETFRMGWSFEGSTTLEGAGSRSIRTISPADENIQGMSFNANDLLVGDYEVTTVAGTAGVTNAAATSYVHTQNSGAATITALASAGQTYNLSVRLELNSISTATGSHVGTFSYSYQQLSVSGVATQGAGNIDLSLTGGNTVSFGGTISYTDFDLTGGSEGWSVGDKIVANTAAYRADVDHDVVIINDPSSANITFNFLSDAINNSTTTFSFYQLDLDPTSNSFGQFRDASVDLTFGALSSSSGVAAGFEIKGGALGQVAALDSAIYDIDRFWDANGNFLVQDPQTINLVQGDGKSTSITIFGSDTIRDIQGKLNNAIHNGLQQSSFNNGSESYVRYVTSQNVESEGFFTVRGTFVIQSAVTGKDGEIRFSGNEGVINALSLTTLQKSEENQFNVTVTNAHDPNDVIAENTRIVGNLLVGVVHENVDVKFDPMAGITTTLDGMTFDWESSDGDSIYIHLSDNTMVFHIGANPLQDVGAAIGDMSAESLGVDNILVTNRESANRAITQLDYAIGRVSSERAKMGALQNRLEHTINNLGVSAENLSAAESRVRDLDFALEMVEFTRNQIMMQAGTSMLAQANMKPQSVLMLLQ